MPPFCDGLPGLSHFPRRGRFYPGAQAAPHLSDGLVSRLLAPALRPLMSAEEANRHIEAIYASSSWRLTWPPRAMRAVKRLLKD